MLGAIAAGASLLGAAANAYSAYSSAKNTEAANKQKAANIAAAREEVDSAYDDVDAAIADYENYVNSVKTTDASTVEKYKSLVNDYDPADYVAERGTFDKSGYDIADYIDSNAEEIKQAAADAVTRSQAGAGIGRGTGAAMSIAEAVAEKDEELNDKAYERMKDDRDFDYTEFQNAYTANQAALDKLNSGVTNQISMLGGAIDTDSQNQADLTADYINAKTGRANAHINLLT